MRLRVSRRGALALAAVVCAAIPAARAQRGGRGGAPAVALEPAADDPYAALRFRGIGPVVNSGRLADVAVDPKDQSIWYVATASGGLWKTTNRGLTFTSIFDNYGTYTMCCVMVDPKNSSIVWLATGEMTNPRSAMAGDGVYKSTDAGASWRRVGLAHSEKLGHIAIDPRNSDVVYIASEGPLWAPGGDRGLFKTTDGGQTWKDLLEPNENTGVSDVNLDPRNPDVMLAAAYERRRNVGVLIGGGPEGGIYKSSDGGATWKKLATGLPTGDIGRIGLARSPQNPDVVYAQITAQDDKSGFFRSEDNGETWVKESNWNSNDPQYYGRIFPDPFHFDRLCGVQTNPLCTNDGGKTTQAMPLQGVHVDFHYIWFDPTDSLHLMVGNDGGLYDSYDRGASWHHFSNLPTLQYYRIAADNSAPFYNVYGGAQDNEIPSTPSRSASAAGIKSADWMSLPGGDGFQTRVDPVETNIVYEESQGGAMERVDVHSGVSKGIQPPGMLDSQRTRSGWDVPYIISPHNRMRLYVFTSGIFRSDNRGDSWTPVSHDLTRHLNADTMLIMGKKWPANAVTKNLYTTPLSVGTTVDESPLKVGLIYGGTDDGLIDVTEDGGKTWHNVGTFPGVPAFTGVTCVLASKHDTSTVYASFNNQWQGDFNPYVLKSTDRGRTWTSIRSNLPDGDQVWTLAEDYVNKNLLFAGTEHGIYMTTDGGGSWTRLKSGLPTIPVRSIELQKRETDLVLGTFGRGIYIMDDYAALRTLASPTIAKAEGTLFAPRSTWVYDEQPYHPSDVGNGEWEGQNPPFGALLTYHLASDQPAGTQIVLTVKNITGGLVAQVCGPLAAGLDRAVWNLRGPAPAEPAGARGGRGGGAAGAGGRGGRGGAGGAGAGARGAGGAGAGRGGGGAAAAAPAGPPSPCGGGAGGGGGRGGGGGAGGAIVTAGTYSVQLNKWQSGKLTPIGAAQPLHLVTADVAPHVR